MKTEQEQIEKIMCMFNKLKRGDYCVDNCYGCCGDEKIDITCHDVVVNFIQSLMQAGYGDISEYKTEREMLGSQIKVLKQRLNDKYIEVDNLNRDYRNAFERLKSQQQEIDGLKAEDERLREVIRQLNTEYNRAWERLKSDCREIGELKAENRQLKTECALLDDELRIARQETIDVLNKLKTKAFDKDAFNGWAGSTFVVLVRDIDKMIDELTNL